MTRSESDGASATTLPPKATPWFLFGERLLRRAAIAGISGGGPLMREPGAANSLSARGPTTSLARSWIAAPSSSFRLELADSMAANASPSSASALGDAFWRLMKARLLFETLRALKWGMGWKRKGKAFHCSSLSLRALFSAMVKTGGVNGAHMAGLLGRWTRRELLLCFHVSFQVKRLPPTVPARRYL